MVSELLEVFWPTLRKESDHDAQSRIEDDIKAINELLAKESEVLLQESVRQMEDEESRKASTESKASNLLVVFVALIPLLTYLESSLTTVAVDPVLSYLNVLLVVLSVLYLLRAALWAFSTVGVSNYYRVYPTDLIRINVRNGGINAESIAKAILCATRRNQDVVNLKVSSLKLTHAFLVRAVVTLSCALLLKLSADFFLGIFSVLLS